jgi:hypothetical protein
MMASPIVAQEALKYMLDQVSILPFTFSLLAILYGRISFQRDCRSA